MRAWRKANPELNRERKKQSDKRNPGSRAARYKRYRERYPEKCRARVDRYLATAKGKEKARLWKAQWRIKNPELARSRWRKHLEKQKAVREVIAGRKCPDICDICERPGNMAFDHCHVTGKFRGWLCTRCNLTLGQVKDSPELLRRMAIYLERSQESEAQAA